MKTLANPNDKNLILERVARLRNDSPHSWGKMSAPQMVCHLCDSFRSKLGGKEVQSRVDLFTLWVTVLLGIGMAVMGKLSRGQAILAATLMWLVGAAPAVWGALKAM